MGDVNIPGAVLTALGDRTQTEFRAREGGTADAATQTGGGANEENAYATVRQHQAGRLAAGEKAGIAGQCPNLAENAFGSVDQH
jgi:hypothetical protein